MTRLQLILPPLDLNLTTIPLLFTKQQTMVKHGPILVLAFLQEPIQELSEKIQKEKTCSLPVQN